MGVFKRPKIKKKGQKQYWYIRFYEDSGKRNKNGNKIYINHVWSVGEVGKINKSEVEDILKREKAKYSNRRLAGVVNEPVTLKRFANLYLDHKKNVEKKKSWKRHLDSLKRVLEFYGDIRLENITPRSIDDYKKYRLDKVKPATVNRELQALRNMFNLAINWNEFHEDNPVKKAGLLREIREEKEPLTDKEITLLKTNLHKPINRIFIFAINTGMRITEILELKKQHLYEYDGVPIIILKSTDTKSGKQRTIPLNKQAKIVIDEAIETAPKSEYVFTNSKGLPYKHYRSVSSVVTRTCKRLGMRKIHPHLWRHTFASRTIEGGANIMAVKDILGHSTVKMLERYVKVDKTRIEAVKSIDASYL